MRGPADGVFFGSSVDINEQFMVVTGWKHSSCYVYVYQSNSPYRMVATSPLDGHDIHSVVLSDDNTVAVTHEDYGHYRLTVYSFDGSASWHIAEKFDLPGRGGPEFPTIAVHGDIIVVGISDTDGDHNGIAQVYNKINGKWTQGQAIKQDGVEYFGWSVAIYGQHMAVSSKNRYVFSYSLDQYTNTWICNGRFSVPGGQDKFVSLYKDVLVVTFNDLKYHPYECGIVYKRTTTNNNNSNSSNASVGTTTTSNKNVIWKEIVRLTTKNDPMTSGDQQNYAVSVDEDMVFIGRADEKDREAFGRVFGHGLTNYNN